MNFWLSYSKKKRKWSEYLQLCRSRKSRNTHRKTYLPRARLNKIYFSKGVLLYLKAGGFFIVTEHRTCK